MNNNNNNNNNLSESTNMAALRDVAPCTAADTDRRRRHAQALVLLVYLTTPSLPARLHSTDMCSGSYRFSQQIFNSP
jgi:hypothetical protein